MQNLDPANPPPSQVVNIESKSARKKKAKAEAAVNGTGSVVPAIPNASAKEDSSLDPKGDGESHSEHPYIRDITKQIRNVHKKLAGMQRIDAIVAENPGVSVDDLVASRKINADQKASLLKKPQLESQLSALEEQLVHYKKFDSESQSQLQKQKEELTAQHQVELDKTREDMRLFGITQSEAELRKKLLVFSQFLRCAAAKRAEGEDPDTEEGRAFEGALLLVYGGDEKAVSAAVKLIEGSEERVPSIDGVELGFTYSQIKRASLEHAPFQVEENWVDSVAEANAAGNAMPDAARGIAPASDPTIAYAGLTELDTTVKDPGVHGVGGEDPLTGPPQADAGDSAGNAAGDNWEATLPGADRGALDDSYEMVPRPQDELDTPVTAAQQEKTSWADDQPPPAYDAGASGNVAGEAWDVKAAGDGDRDAWPSGSGAEAALAAGASGAVDGADDTTSGAAQEDADGFQSVPGRHRGRGGRGRPDDFRGRGRGRGGFRGRGEGGEFRGRGGYRGDGYRGRGDGEFRGRGGRGRPFNRGNGEGLGMGRGA